MQPETMTCDDFQIAFEQHGADAVAAIPREEVDEHFAACATCTAYASASRKVAASMSTAIATAPFDADSVRAQIKQTTEKSTLWVPLSTLFFGLTQVPLQLHSASGKVPQALVAAAIATALWYVGMRFITRRRGVQLSKLSMRTGDDLVVGWRAEMDRRVKQEAQGWYVFPILVVVIQAVFAGTSLPTPFVFAMELLMLAMLPLTFIRHRRAKRERALLG